MGAPRKGGRGSPCGEGSWEGAAGYVSTQSLGGMGTDIRVWGGRGELRMRQNPQPELGTACTLEPAQANTMLPPTPCGDAPSQPTLPDMRGPRSARGLARLAGRMRVHTGGPPQMSVHCGQALGSSSQAVPREGLPRGREPTRAVESDRPKFKS